MFSATRKENNFEASRAINLRWAIVIATVAASALIGVVSTSSESIPSTVWLLIMGVAAFFLLLLERPWLEILFLLFVAFFVPFELGVSTSVSVNAMVFALPLIFLLWLLRLVVGRTRPILSRTMIPMLVLTTVMFVSFLYGNANWDTRFPRPGNLMAIQMGQMAIYMLSFVAFFLAAQQSSRSIKQFTRALIGLSILALFVRYSGLHTTVIGNLVNPVYSNGTVFVWLTALAGGQALFNDELDSKKRKLLFVIAVLVPILGFAFNTQWASSWLPPLVVLGILLWLKSRYASVALMIVLMALLLVFSSVLFAYFDWETEREVSVGARFTLWDSVLQLALEEPVLGLGITTYRQYHQFIPLLTEHGLWYQPNVNSHNVYLDIFAQMGVVGLLALLWAFASIGFLAWRLRSQKLDGFGKGYVNALLAGTVGILFASMIVEWILPFVYNVGFNGFRFSVFSWLLFGGLVVFETKKVAGGNSLPEEAEVENSLT